MAVEKDLAWRPYRAVSNPERRHRPTGNAIEARRRHVVTTAAGRVSEVRMYVDVYNSMAQLRLLG